MAPHEAISTATSTMSSWWDSLPHADTPAAPDAEPSAFGPRQTGVSRRTFMQVVLALGGGLALTGLQAISGVKLKPAGATVGTEYTDCAGYSDWPGYTDNSLVCVGGPYSYIYCGSDGWFKNGYFDNGNTLYRPKAFCGDDGRTARNAWRWSHGAYRYRCADGYFWVYKDGAWRGPYFKICSQWIGYA